MNELPLRIGLSARLMHSPPKELGFTGKTLQYLEQSLAHWIMANGALAFMIPTLSQDGGVHRSAVSVRDYVSALDGLVLQGGADVSPESYGEQPLRPEWAGDRIRDLFEMELVWEFIIQGKPVLGICRGAQLINVACGGSLYQDIAEQFPSAGIHRDHALYDGFHHEIEIVAGSRLATLFSGASIGSVNSIHHQAIKTLGNDLIIEARACGDGVIEAIRWTGSGYMFGCQWHPEFQITFPNLIDSSPIMSDFLDASKAARLKSSVSKQISEPELKR
ncbi:gamma-glutamyl-gamma-aminobutyrate hydrolase family protein [Solimicrobium silvestre]|uniref:Putative glutamine amidotransferase n=1 Tax=Solimicrobium silvestre TaxID=2099400 RepID=A0A2S9GYI5_9BURK|nr:type 1 glutamine amidotransferase [Solimicrobium silvestre]PRC92787.1 putative glutamine amidotransferase [Solimicrobium silvestre]